MSCPGSVLRGSGGPELFGGALTGWDGWPMSQVQEQSPPDKGQSSRRWCEYLWPVEIPAGLPKLFIPAQCILASVNTISLSQRTGGFSHGSIRMSLYPALFSALQEQNEGWMDVMGMGQGLQPCREGHIWRGCGVTPQSEWVLPGQTGAIEDSGVPLGKLL